MLQRAGFIGIACTGIAFTGQAKGADITDDGRAMFARLLQGAGDGSRPGRIGIGREQHHIGACDQLQQQGFVGRASQGGMPLQAALAGAQVIALLTPRAEHTHHLAAQFG